MSDDIRTFEAGTISKLDLKPSDTLVVQCDGYLSKGTVDRIIEDFKRLDISNRVIVLDGGLTLGVLSAIEDVA